MNQRRKRFTIYRRTQTLVDGEENTTISEVSKVWGKKRTLKANEVRVSPDRPEEFSDERFYFSPYEDIRFRDLIYDGVDAYRVQSTTNRTGTKNHLEVDCMKDVQATKEIEAL